MLTLRELRNMVEVAEVEGRVPSVKALLGAKVPIIVKELLSEQAEIFCISKWICTLSGWKTCNGISTSFM